MDLDRVMLISAAGMKVQGARLKVIAENLANANSTGETPDDLPYRRKTITFRNVLDRELGIETVQVRKVGVDPGDFQRRYDPSHPSADAEGYVLFPNVNTLVEAVDMREAQRSYEANLNVIETSRMMLNRTIDILRS
jgi:flagellar basal-body rod protein FlgC